LRTKLDRLDTASRYGPWTQRTLACIKSRPKERAGDLAEELDLPKDWLKVSIRKLKNLGLTISHEPGYELSPRGARLLRELKKQ
jgi:predicted transcriptional regulator